MIRKKYTEEYIKINGLTQYFLHYPSAQEEVVIMLHGGPGSSTAFIAHHLRPYWDFCNVIYYDQRGTGRTHLKSKLHQRELTLENMIADLRQTIRYAKKKYKTDRIILLGHSWGTVLGTQYILQYPDDVLGYIGTGQVVDTRREMKAAYAALGDAIKRAGNKRDWKKLRDFGDYPNADVKNYEKYAMRFLLLQSKYGHALNFPKLLWLMLKSPIFWLSDLFLVLSGPKTNQQLINALLEYSIWNITQYPVPVYYILGRNDWQVPSTIAAAYFEKIQAPRKALYWIENAGHVADADNPADFCKAVREIVAQL